MTTHRQFQPFIKSVYLSMAVALVTSLSLPLLALGGAAADCLQPDSTSSIQHPTSPDATAYTYNCESGMWESEHFIFNPATSATTPKIAPTYAYNVTTGGYDVTMYAWDATNNAYIATTQNVATPPTGATVVGQPLAPTPTGNSITNTGADSTNTIDNNGGASDGATISNTGADSTNTVDGTHSTTTNNTTTTTATIDNTITATATSGTALVIDNTVAGSAQSGNAQDVANVVNLLQSSSSALGNGAVTFVANIDGDVNGDLLFDPAQIGNIQPAGANGAAAGNTNITVNSTLNASITNTIDLTAKTGDATVSQNTKAGDAKTGTATTIANVVNLINSAVSSGKSFMGTININGNLNGDILVPTNFIDQLVSANTPTVSIDTTGSNSTNTINSGHSDSIVVNNTNNMGVTNTINTSASSGTATVSENTKAGDAKTGTAQTNITAFNLTGSQVIGRNAMLVFVNVTGTWVGLIVNAPAGTTAAAYGGGLTENTSSSHDTTINSTNNLAITNNITTSAQSGNASVTRNTEAGSATSGDARGTVNLANIENSSLSLSNWFGILFINVFGTWHGSFGMNTSAGDPVAAAASPTIVGSAFGAATAPAFFGFAARNNPTASKTSTPTGTSNTASTVAAATTPELPGSVLAAATVKSAQAPAPDLSSKPSNFTTKAAIILAITAAVIVLDALYNRRKQHSKIG